MATPAASEAKENSVQPHSAQPTWFDVASPTAAAACAVTGAAVGAVSACSRAGPSGGASSASAAKVIWAVGCGGVGAFLLWRWRLASRPFGNVLQSIDEDPTLQPSPKHAQRVEDWLGRLFAERNFQSPALRIAAHAFPRLKSSWHADAADLRRLQQVLRRQGVCEDTISRACHLLDKKGAAVDLEKAALEDAKALVFLEFDLLKVTDFAQLSDDLQKVFKILSPSAQAFAVGFDYERKVLNSLLEALASSQGLLVTSSPMVAPRLPAKTVAALREMWTRVTQEQQVSFGNEFLGRLFVEDPSLRQVFDYPCFNAANIDKVVQLMLDFLDTELVPRLELLVQALTALGKEHGSLRMKHLAPIKRSLVRSIVAHMPAKEKKKANRTWEAFCYSVAAVAAPQLLLGDGLQELTAATAATLPIPGGGAHAGAIAAHGVGLLESALAFSAKTQGGVEAPREVLGKLCEARNWLMDFVRNDVNAFCGLLASDFAQQDTVSGETGPGVEAERRRWERRAMEVPVRIAEVSVGAAKECLSYGKLVKPSLKVDWIAGARLLRTAMEISLKKVHVDLRESRGPKGGNEKVEQLYTRLANQEQPWDDLCNIDY